MGILDRSIDRIRRRLKNQDVSALLLRSSRVMERVPTDVRVKEESKKSQLQGDMVFVVAVKGGKLGVAVYKGDKNKGTYKVSEVTSAPNIPGIYHATRQEEGKPQISGLVRDKGLYTVRKDGSVAKIT